MCVCVCTHICIYICVCIYVYICVCMYICVYICMYICVCMCMCIYVCICVYICVYMCVYVCIYVYICTYICMYVCLFTHICMYVCVYVCICVCMCIYMCIYVYIYVYIYLYVHSSIIYRYYCLLSLRLLAIRTTWCQGLCFPNCSSISTPSPFMILPNPLHRSKCLSSSLVLLEPVFHKICHCSCNLIDPCETLGTNFTLWNMDLCHLHDPPIYFPNFDEVSLIIYPLPWELLNS